MRKKFSLVALTPVALSLQLGLALAAPDRGVEVRWEGLSEQQPSKLWIRNLSARPAEAALESTSAGGASAGSDFVSLQAGETVEVPAAPLGKTFRLRGNAELFVLQVPEGFDAGMTELDGAPAVRLSRVDKRLRATVNRPEWVQGLVSHTSSLEKGSIGSAAVASESSEARVEVAVAFLQRGGSVRIRLLDSRGEELTSLVASSSRPVRWRTSLGQIPADGTARVELSVLRGKVQGTVAAVEPGTGSVRRVRVAAGTPEVLAKSGGGQGYFNYEIHWSYTPDLYYSVAGAPAGVCGTSWVTRNGGAWQPTPGWICTDAAGNATKGPWSWANQPNDETAYAYIEWPWPYSSTTNTSRHIWDKTCATTTITSPIGYPPGSFYGAATDAQWGAGFNSNWTTCFAHFYNSTTGKYWTPSAGGYNATSNFFVPLSISGMPGMTITWNASQLPPGYTHVSGQCYEWTACCTDGACGYCDTHFFCT